MDIDEVFEHIGEMGPSQMKMFIMLNLPTIWSAMFYLVINFIGSDPGWNCTITNPEATSAPDCSTGSEGCIDSNIPQSILITDPVEKCRYYDSGDCTPEFYDTYTSIVTEWELICGRSSYPNLSQSAFFLGLMAGAWPFGALGDKYGRKKIVFLALVVCALTGLGIGMATSFIMFVALRFFLGFIKQALSVVGFTLIVEMVGASKRSFVAMFSHAFFSIGVCILVILAYFIRSWRILCLFTTLIGVGFLAMWKFIPESPRWLLVQGRESEARSVLSAIAQGNGNQMISTRLKKPVGKDSKNSASVIDLFKDNEIRKRTLILLVTWFTNCVVYYGLSMMAGSLGGGRYLSLLLSGLVELPGLYISFILLNRIGRKLSHAGLLILAGICCIGWAFGNWAGWSESLTISLALLGKCAVTSSFSIICLFSAELYPTEVRTLGMGVVSVSSRLGGFLSPIILLMSSVSVGMPMIVMGSLGLIAGFMSLYLPETLNQPLPETLEELKCLY